MRTTQRTIVANNSDTADSTEYEDEVPQRPKNWTGTISKIMIDPSSFESIVVEHGPRKLNGIYNCMGVKNNRPYYKKNDADFVIWYDAIESSWNITDSEGLTLGDPDLYGYIDSVAWDVTKISNSINWKIAGAKGNWIKRENMKVNKVGSSKVFPNTSLTKPVSAPALAALAAANNNWPLSLTSSVWEDLRKLRAEVKENRWSINEINNKLAGIIQTQRDILGKLEKLENDTEQKRGTDLARKIEQVEEKVKLLANRNKRSKRKLVKGYKPRVDHRSVEELIRENCVEKASLRAMKAYLAKKKKERVMIDGKRIVLYGNKQALLERIMKVVKKSGEGAPAEVVNSNEMQRIRKLTKINKLRADRDLRARARQKRKEELEVVGKIRKRLATNESYRVVKKLRKRTILA